MAGSSIDDVSAGAYGANAWLVEEMYDSYLADPTSVSESWREFFADYKSASRSASVTHAGSDGTAGIFAG
ncbi:MAG: 2-oxoglutarate dehydrogenase E1 subunit family protein, partial [Acidimicrobiales bacterium]